jgi:hypothetical protein
MQKYDLNFSIDKKDKTKNDFFSLSNLSEVFIFITKKGINGGTCVDQLTPNSLFFCKVNVLNCKPIFI